MTIRKFFAPVILLFFSIFTIGTAIAQPFNNNDRYVKLTQKIGSTKIQNTTLELIAVFRQDSALLLASITDADKPTKYIPLMSSVDSRETAAMDLSIFSSESGEKIWIYFQSTEDPKNKGFLAYYILGSETSDAKLFSFGQKLLDTPTPSRLSISDKIIPGFGRNKVKRLATFHFSGREERAAQPN